MPGANDTSPRRAAVLLTAVLILACGLRIWGVRFGLPYVTHPDEARFVMTAVKILQTGDWNPGWFQQPSLYSYLTTAAMSVYFLLGASRGQFTTTSDLFRPAYHQYWGKVPYPGEFLAPRLLSVFLGVATVWLLYDLGRRVASRRTGLVAAAALAVSYHHVSSSHFATNDVAGTFLVLAVTWISLRLHASQEPGQWYVPAGLVCGLAASTRYNYAVAVVPLVASHFVRAAQGRGQVLTRPALGAFASCLAGFLIGTPHALLDTPRFLDGVAYELGHHLHSGHIGAEGNSARWFILHLLSGSARAMTVGGVMGGVWCASQTKLRSLVLLSFPVVYFAAMSGSVVHFERFLVPLMPFLALGTALAVTEMLAPRVRLGRGGVGLACGLLTLVVTVEPLANVLAYDYRLAQQDVQVMAATWIRDNLPEGATIAAEKFSAPLSPTDYDLVAVDSLTDLDADSYRERGVEYFVLGALQLRHLSAARSHYAEEYNAYQRFLDCLEPLQVLRGPFVGWPDYEVVVYRWRDDG